MFDLQKKDKSENLSKWNKFYILDSNQRHHYNLSCALIWRIDREKD